MSINMSLKLEEENEFKSNQRQNNSFANGQIFWNQPEFRQQLAEIAKRIEELLKDKHGECKIPDDLIKEIARCLVPDIIAFFETEEAKREFEEWKLEQEKKLAEKSKNEAMPK